jgi:hypothetical protein
MSLSFPHFQIAEREGENTVQARELTANLILMVYQLRVTRFLLAGEGCRCLVQTKELLKENSNRNQC